LGRRRKDQLDLPPRRRSPPIKLGSTGEILTEMQRLYRMAKGGLLPTDDMGRLIFGLREIRASLETEPQVIDCGSTVNIAVIGVPSGAQIDSDSNRIVYPDGTVTAPVPFCAFVPSPDIPELEPTARIAQLEERVELLEKRNAYVEHLLDPKRPMPAVLSFKPQLVIDNVDAEVVDTDDGPP
jgi:hypothetical protein